MAATTTYSTDWLITKLTTDYPAITFAAGDDFAWLPDTHTIAYKNQADSAPYILHELAHAILEHTNYRRDIELLQLERQAWDYAGSTLAPRYSVSIDDEQREQALDSYRDWLHARSTCPTCTATGLQTATSTYRCPACQQQWYVNEARNCRLQRHTSTGK